MTDNKDRIRHLESIIEEERLYGATAEDLRPYTDLLLTFLLADADNKLIERAREQYKAEKGTDADLKTLALFDTVLQQRS